MAKYNIRLSPKAYSDLKRINEYIVSELLEPNIAYDLFRVIINAIYELDNFPNRNPRVILNKNIHKDLRKMWVKNYLIFDDVEETIKIVNIRRILYGASDWRNKL